MPITSSIIISGSAEIQVGSGSGGAGGPLEHLGFTRDGVNMRFDGFFLDIKTDDFGGEGGPGADTQYLGATCNISMELTKWDYVTANKLINRLNINGSVPGHVVTTNIGSLMIGGGKSFRVLIAVPNPATLAAMGAGCINFPNVVMRDAIELNKGTKYSTLRIEAVAWCTAAGVLFDTDRSGELSN